MIIFPTSTASSLLANITSQLSDTGTLLIVVLAASIPLSFYIIEKIISLFPKDKHPIGKPPPLGQYAGIYDKRGKFKGYEKL